MKIKLYMENGTDDMAMPKKLGKFDNVYPDGVYQCWFDCKQSEPKLDEPEHQISKIAEIHIREETFGGLALNRTNGRVYVVDKEGLRAFYMLRDGAPVRSLYEMSMDRTDVDAFIEYCIKGGLLPLNERR